MEETTSVATEAEIAAYVKQARQARMVVLPEPRDGESIEFHNLDSETGQLTREQSAVVAKIEPIIIEFLNHSGITSLAVALRLSGYFVALETISDSLMVGIADMRSIGNLSKFGLTDEPRPGLYALSSLGETVQAKWTSEFGSTDE